MTTGAGGEGSCALCLHRGKLPPPLLRGKELESLPAAPLQPRQWEVEDFFAPRSLETIQTRSELRQGVGWGSLNFRGSGWSMQPGGGDGGGIGRPAMPLNRQGTSPKHTYVNLGLHGWAPWPHCPLTSLQPGTVRPAPCLSPASQGFT